MKNIDRVINKFDSEMKKFILKVKYSKQIRFGKGAILRDNCQMIVDEKGFINIGDRCFIGNYTVVYAVKRISIGRNVLVAPFCYITDSQHDPNNLKIKVLTKEIEIGDNSWVGTHSVILPGAKIGKNCVIAAGSVVTKDVPSNCMVAGVPAKIIKKG